MPAVTLLTDFGTADWYVAAVKGTLLRLAPGITPVDVTHEVTPGDVEAGAWLLAAAAPTFPSGTVHLAVVDPGVGSERRVLVVAAGGMLFVGPDNGLLLPAAEAVAAAAARGSAAASGDRTPVYRAVGRRDLWLPAPGSTFHGRDRFAPTAAHLAAGGDPAGLGAEIADPVRLVLPEPRREGPAAHPGTLLSGRVAHVDRFGNLVTDLPAAWLGDRPCQAVVGSATDGHTTARRADHYRQIPPGEAAVLVGSLATLELSLDGDHLARRWGVGRGDPVRVTVG